MRRKISLIKSRLLPGSFAPVYFDYIRATSFSVCIVYFFFLFIVANQFVIISGQSFDKTLKTDNSHATSKKKQQRFDD